MHEQQRAKQLDNIKNMVDELAECPLLTAHMVQLLGKRLPNPRDFALRLTAASKGEGKELLGHISESYKPTSDPVDLGSFFRQQLKK